MLDIEKVYVDTRYKSDDSRSDSDFTIELPRTLNIPENTVCYLTDVVIPVSWSTIDARNNKLYIFIDVNPTTKFYKTITIPSRNYSGPDFCEALGLAINAAMELGLVIAVSYNKNDNMITINQTNHYEISVDLVSSADLQAGRFWSTSLTKESIHSMNGILRIGKKTYRLRDAYPWIAYLDLHTTRNIYIYI